MISEQIARKYGEEYLLRQLAEECGELTQACLKLVRAWRGETPVEPEEANEKLIEEMADVQLMMYYVLREVIGADKTGRFDEIMDMKEARMYDRMIVQKGVHINV